MTRVDVYRERASSWLSIDCQDDVSRTLETRFVVPLLPPFGDAPAFPGLNPVFDLDGKPFVMITQRAANIPVTALGMVADREWDMSTALDLVLTGV